ncbi:sirohydrochlorin chelatase [Microbacterium sp.]|uniref:sirohydrochlorin chelatase n=1 Tax=Microbacterium sp. TaxID=51671 RepID=UPI0039E4182E
MASPALLAVSHGTGNVSGQRAVAALVDAVAARLPAVTVRLAHVDVQQPDAEAALAALNEDLAADQPVVIVPLLLSAGYHVHVDLARAASTRPGTRVARALGPDPRLAEILADRLRELDTDPDPDPDPDTEPSTDVPDAVVLAVAGSSDQRANEDCRRTGALLSARLGHDVSIGFLAAAAPSVAQAVADAAASGRRVAVASYLLAPGYFHDLTVRQAGPGARVSRPLLTGDAPPPRALVDLVIDRFLH